MSKSSGPGRRLLAAAAAVAVAGVTLVAVSPAAPAADPPPPPDPVFDFPSAAGERLLLEQAGLLPAETAGAPAAAGTTTLAGPAAATTGEPGGGAPGDPLTGEIRVNDPTLDSGDSTTQNETALVVLDDTVCGGYNDFGPGGLSGWSRSTDGGLTWTDETGTGDSGDPVLAVHEATRTFYYASLGSQSVQVRQSTDECDNFGAAVNASQTGLSPATTLADKPWIAVDNTGGPNDGDVYVCWTRFFSGGSELRFSRSNDAGATYIGEQILAATGTSPFGCSVQVGPDGAVHVVWADRSTNDILTRTSTDGGVTFASAVTVNSGAVRHPGTDTVVNCAVGGAPTNNRPTLTGNWRQLHGAWMAIDTTGGPYDGTIYVVWASDPAGTPDNADVYFSRSTDGGATWSAMVQLGGGGGNTDQAQPNVAVASGGAVGVTWYDRRNDTANNTNLDVYTAYSTDGGASFGGLVRVTSQSFGVPQLLPHYNPGTAQCYMGEYIAIAGDADSFHYLWGDNRDTVTNTNWPSGRPDPNAYYRKLEAPIVGTADVGIAKTDLPDPVAAGEVLTYTLSVTNNGPAPAPGVVVTDTLPAAVAYLGDDAGCVAGPPGTLTCDLGELAVGETRVVTITVRVDPGTVASGVTLITNTASVDGPYLDDNPANDSASASTTVVERADVRTLKECKPDDPVDAGVVVNCTITVENLGPSTARAVTLTDEILSDGPFTLGTVTTTAGSCAAGPVTATGQTVTCSLGDRGAGTTATVLVPVSASVTRDINDIATATSPTPDPDQANNVARESVHVQAVADLAVTKTDSPDPVVAGEPLAYTVTVTNSGPSPAEAVVLDDWLSAGVSITSVSASVGSCNAGVPGDAARPTTCQLGTLASGGSATVTINTSVLPGTTGAVHNDAQVASSTIDRNGANNAATETTAVIANADLSVVKTDTPDPVAAGTALTYSIYVTNVGPSVARDVSLTDTLALPPGVSITGWSIANGTGVCQTNPVNVVSCQLGDLGPGDYRVVAIDVTVAASVPDATVIADTVTVASSTPDPNPGNNTDTEDTTVQAVADLGLEKLSDRDLFKPSTTVVYTLRVTNRGPSDAQAVQVVDTLPDSKIGYWVFDDGYLLDPDGCALVSTTLTCDIGTVASGAVAEIHVYFRVVGNKGTVTNTATVSSTTTDPNAADNAAVRKNLIQGKATGKR